MKMNIATTEELTCIVQKNKQIPSRKTECKWKDKVIEEEREFNYLGITLKKMVH